RRNSRGGRLAAGLGTAHALMDPRGSIVQTWSMRRSWIVMLLLLLAGSSEINRQTPQENKRFRLEVHVPDQAGIYFTAWGDGDVITDHDASDKRVVTYKRRS